MKRVINRLILISVLILIILMYTYIVDIKSIKNSYQINNETISFDEEPKYINEDIVGNLAIKSIGLNVTLVQGLDNEFYLNHNLYKQNSKFGSIFLDYQSDLMKEQVNIIYGHSSKEYNLPFNILKKYLDHNYLINHNLITISYLKNDLTYHIIDAYSSNSLKKIKGDYLVIQTCDQEID